MQKKLFETNSVCYNTQDGAGKSPKEFHGKEYVFQESPNPRPGNKDQGSRGPRYFRIGMSIEEVKIDVFLRDIMKGKNQKFEYLLRYLDIIEILMIAEY